MNTFLQDLRQGLRLLLKNKTFTAISVLTLALGVGANTAIFSVVTGVLLRPLPYSDPARLVQFWETNPLKGWTQATVAPANLSTGKSGISRSTTSRRTWVPTPSKPGSQTYS